MDFGRWDTLFNFLLLFFWFGIWSARERNTAFNPFLAPLSRAVDATVAFLKPVLPWLSDRQICAAALSVLLVLRALAVPRGAVWRLVMGFEHAAADPTGLVTCLGFSVVSLGIFLFKLWGLSLLYARTGHGPSSVHPVSALYYLSRPFSTSKPIHRPWILLVFGVATTMMLHTVSGAVPPFSMRLLFRAGISTLAAWVNVLLVIRFLLLILIVVSWVGMLTASHVSLFLCKEWIDLLLGPARKFPIRIGMFDLTPILFLFVLQFAHSAFMGILFAAYQSVP